MQGKEVTRLIPALRNGLRQRGNCTKTHEWVVWVGIQREEMLQFQRSTLQAQPGSSSKGCSTLGAQKPCGMWHLGTRGHGLGVALAVLDLMALKVFFNHSDSVIPCRKMFKSALGMLYLHFLPGNGTAQPMGHPPREKVWGIKGGRRFWRCARRNSTDCPLRKQSQSFRRRFEG